MKECYEFFHHSCTLIYHFYCHFKNFGLNATLGLKVI